MFTTDRGKAAHALLRIEEYQRVTDRRQKIADLLAMPGVEDIALDVPPLGDCAQPADVP